VLKAPLNSDKRTFLTCHWCAICLRRFCQFIVINHFDNSSVSAACLHCTCVVTSL